MPLIEKDENDISLIVDLSEGLVRLKRSFG
jgi:hypothetical protein